MRRFARSSSRLLQLPVEGQEPEQLADTQHSQVERQRPVQGHAPRRAVAREEAAVPMPARDDIAQVGQPHQRVRIIYGVADTCMPSEMNPSSSTSSSQQGRDGPHGNRMVRNLEFEVCDMAAASVGNAARSGKQLSRCGILGRDEPASSGVERAGSIRMDKRVDHLRRPAARHILLITGPKMGWRPPPEEVHAISRPSVRRSTRLATDGRRSTPNSWQSVSRDLNSRRS